MTKKAIISQAELMRMATAARKHGVVVEREIDGVITRVTPFHELPKVAAPEPNHWDAVLEDAPPEPIQPPFDHRERYVMERLIDLGVGVRTYSCTIRSFGPHTQSKLLERGYVEVTNSIGDKFKDDEISLTRKGLADFKALERHRSKYPSL
ncbi:hypothetical protein M0654_03890 [Rhizobium sp. NTR19]|uniref:Uncharacterized protein n=1 Tax=Neorhizobium turbinariae TaxID=2937795 RepID=A0ABT0IMP5_9HYPH|nr:hypothetical protein [Neorhizobium turbinariae]MCK8779121.1 hypothetical protein [Neorhizobium turbinariae]